MVSIRMFLISMVAVVSINAGLLIYVSSSLNEEITATRTAMANMDERVESLSWWIEFGTSNDTQDLYDIYRAVKNIQENVDIIELIVGDIEGDVKDIKYHFNIW